MSYTFRTIDLIADLGTCVRFRRDSYQISFGGLDGFDDQMNTYTERMTARIAELPEGNCHLWREQSIIGQTEMCLDEDPEGGYVKFFYLAPGFRGLGLGQLLHARATEVLKALGKRWVNLSVSRTNHAAQAFYAKHGWENLGPRPDKPTVYLMRYSLS